MKPLTPAQRQYADLKAQHEDCLLFFRLGDFYELFYDDAKIAHTVLGITLTAKNKQSENPIPMAGIPYHSLQKYLPRLIDAGYKVAIAEQTSLPTPGKVVEREVVAVHTPGTYTDNTEQSVVILAVAFSIGMYDVSRGDASLGVYYTASFNSLSKIQECMQRIRPQEVVSSLQGEDHGKIKTICEALGLCLSVSSFVYSSGSYVQEILGVGSLIGFGDAFTEGRVVAFGVLAKYVLSLSDQNVLFYHKISQYVEGGDVIFDSMTLRNLEIFESTYHRSGTFSLFGVLDETVTPLGKRFLQALLVRPTNRMQKLVLHQSLISYFQTTRSTTKRMLTELSKITDIQRMYSQIVQRKIRIHGLQSFRNTLEHIFGSEAIIEALHGSNLMNQESIDCLSSVSTMLSERIVSDLISTDYGYIARGWDDEIDSLFERSTGVDSQLLEYQSMIVRVTGVQNVKLKYVKNKGYLVEVTPKDLHLFEDCISMDDPKFDFVPTQRLKSGQRFVSTFLSQLEESMYEARDALRKKEQDVYDDICLLLSERSELHLLFDAIAQVDFFSSHALFAARKGWTLPVLHDDYLFEVTEGRHPVVEEFLPSGVQFIPNDCDIHDDQRFWFITGPNMGGKSTFLRQNALIVLLSHCGCAVPAKSATVGLVDGIFARVGSGDVLAENQSTFMTEMLEMSKILHSCSDRSFIVLDELGRGTSTYDGMALVRAIAEYICEEVGCKTLFASHYHELSRLASTLRGFSNWSVDVYEGDGSVVFLKKIVPGSAGKSYGIEVAKIAGIPQKILKKAYKYLGDHHIHVGSEIVQQSLFSSQQTLSNACPIIKLSRGDMVLKEIQKLDLTQMTPLECLTYLDALQNDNEGIN